MANVHTLKNTNLDIKYPTIQKGHRLGSTREQELEEALRNSIKSNSELDSEFKNLQEIYSKFSKNIKQNNTQLQRDLKQAYTNINRLRSHALQLISEVKRLQNEITNYKSQNNRQQIIINKNDIKLNSIQNKLSEKSSEIKKLKTNLTLSQNNSSLKESENKSLKSKLVESEQIKDKLLSKINELEQIKYELSLKVDEIEQLKLTNTLSDIQSKDIIVSQIELLPKSITGGDKSNSKPFRGDSTSHDILIGGEPIKDLSKFLRKKNTDQDSGASVIDTKCLPQAKTHENLSNKIVKVDNMPLDNNNSEISTSKTSDPEISVIAQPMHQEIPIDSNSGISVESIDIIPPVIGATLRVIK
ncbi:hypothetical protein Glove_115g104 [Diversispora epigaea]|uniref:Uncharacterized protein n=1 Tax=Diversispora epigaea TaxID=1348612 RepID=A0A397J4V5_9GLOM|nr:hypothetical protein Glove_115g104 [Diversispora epigaea]